MPNVLFVDDRPTTISPYISALEKQSEGYSIFSMTDPSSVTQEFLEHTSMSLAVVDMSFPRSPLSGLDVLTRLHIYSPETRLLIFSNADRSLSRRIELAWEALPIAAAAAKNDEQTFVELARWCCEEVAPLRRSDEELAMWLPEVVNPARRYDNWEVIMEHAGHARLVQALYSFEDEPSHQVLSNFTGNTLNAVRGYIQFVRDRLEYVMGYPRMLGPELHSFMRDARPLLEAHVARKSEKGQRAE